MSEKVVLVAEDDEDLVTIYRNLLEHSGFRVLVASTGDEALSMVRERRGKIDLVLSDIVMDGMGGRELIWRVRESYPGIRVILASGYADQDAALQMIGEQDIAFIPKPIDFDLLLQTVRETVSG